MVPGNEPTGAKGIACASPPPNPDEHQGRRPQAITNSASGQAVGAQFGKAERAAPSGPSRAPPRSQSQGYGTLGHWEVVDNCHLEPFYAVELAMCAKAGTA